MVKLKLGDKIYVLNRVGISRIIEIERVTKTMAISGNSKFRQSESEYIDLIGRQMWSTESFKLETPELKTQWQYQQALYKVKNVDYTKCSIEQLNKIIEIIN